MNSNRYEVVRVIKFRYEVLRVTNFRYEVLRVTNFRYEVLKVIKFKYEVSGWPTLEVLRGIKIKNKGAHVDQI